MPEETAPETKYRYGSLAEFLSASDKTIVLDGGFGTELEARGVNVNSTLWSSAVLLNDPAVISRLHYDYYASGAGVATTCSYQCSAKQLADFGEETREKHSRTNIYGTAAQRRAVYERCVQVAKEARESFMRDKAGLQEEEDALVKPMISGSVGPYGAGLCDGSEFSGAYRESIETYKAFHRERVEFFLRDPEVDVLSIETVPVFDEIKALVSLIEDDLMPALPERLAETKKYILSFSIRDPLHLADGTAISAVVEYLKHNTKAFANGHLAAIGGNCLKLQFSTEFLRNLQQSVPAGFPLVIYPNSGEIYDGIKRNWRRDPQLASDKAYEWENVVLEWIRNGARIVGGCCRVGPQDIERISRVVKQHNRSLDNESL